jgi:hypothetical protein
VNKLCSIARLLLLLLPFSAATQVKDTLFFKNGDLLVGEIKSLSLGKIKFDDDNMDVLNIKITQIKTIQALTHVYRLETISEEIYYTTLEAAASGYVRIKVNGLPQDVRIEDISTLSSLKGKTGALWQGTVSAGYNYAKSTGIGQFNSTFTVDYLTKKWDLQANGSVIVNQTDSSFQIDNATSGLFNSYLFTPVWEASVFVLYQRNLQQGLSRRYQEGLGGGAKFISTNHMRAKLITGAVINQEKSVEGVSSPTQVDIPVIMTINFFRFNRPDLTINLTEDVFIGITKKGRIRQDGQLKLNWKLFNDFYLNIQFYHNYDNQPPGQDSEKLDYGVVFGVSYKFSQ